MIKEKKGNEVFRGFNIQGDGIQPKRSSKYSAGYDFFPPIEFTLQPNEDIVIDLGVIYTTTESTDVLKIFPRSGMGFNYIRLANNVAIIDADYDGTIKLKLRNEGTEIYHHPKGKACAQGIIESYTLITDDECSDRIRSDNGFGSSDSLTVTNNVNQEDSNNSNKCKDFIDAMLFCCYGGTLLILFILMCEIIKSYIPKV